MTSFLAYLVWYLDARVGILPCLACRDWPVLIGSKFELLFGKVRVANLDSCCSNLTHRCEPAVLLIRSDDVRKVA